MNSLEKKNSKKVLFSSFSDLTLADDVIDKLETLFRSKGIVVQQDIATSRCIESEHAEMPAVFKTCKSLKREVNQSLADLHKLLSKELSNSLSAIVTEIFDDPSEEADIETSIKVLTIFYKLLSATTLTEDNSSRMLRWIYEIC